MKFILPAALSVILTATAFGSNADAPATDGVKAPESRVEYGFRAHAVKKASRLERLSLYRAYKAGRLNRKSAEVKAASDANAKAAAAAEARAEGK